MRNSRNPFRQPLFWFTFFATYLDLSHAWSGVLVRIVSGKTEIHDVVWIAVLTLASCHLWWERNK
ncbi:hypothetical protein ABIA85_005943 [Bradyrhizobium sp. LA6.10]